jgi:predicted RNase H-like HicB family nuclease
MINYTAKYTKIDSGYLGQLIEWPEVVTEGKDLEECRAMLRDALHEMVLAYRQLGKEIPAGNALIEQLPVEVERVGQAPPAVRPGHGQRNLQAGRPRAPVQMTLRAGHFYSQPSKSKTKVSAHAGSKM